QVIRLRTVPGVGPRTAEAVAAYLHEPGRFKSGQEVGAYAGLVPALFQSGTSDRRGRITRRGPAGLRKLRVECAGVMLQLDRWEVSRVSPQLHGSGGDSLLSQEDVRTKGRRGGPDTWGVRWERSSGRNPNSRVRPSGVGWPEAVGEEASCEGRGGGVFPANSPQPL